jgi:SpoIID/LytB domain protein
MKTTKNKPVIQVGILTSDEIQFELTGNYYDERHHAYTGRIIAKICSEHIELRQGSNTVLINQEISLIPEKEEESFLKILDVTIGIGFHWQKKEDQVFKGGLKLIRRNATITAINIIAVEDYLVSVISSEMSAISSLEMLKSHAVISRSWLLAQIEKGKKLVEKDIRYESVHRSEDEITVWYDREDHQDFDVCADDHCQRYQGITKASTPVAEKAVMSTTGEILEFDGHLCDTRFSKCCGGMTEVFENVWEPVRHPYLQHIYDGIGSGMEADLTSEDAAEAWILSNPDSFCNTGDKEVLATVLNDYDQTTHDFYRWKVQYTTNELSELLKSKTGIDFGEVKELVPVLRGISGRLIKLRIIGSKKTLVIGKELEIRKALSKTHLYSSAFIVKKVNTDFVIYGAGWGHGVGLCQIGAAVMGAKGYSYKDILLHYFRSAKINQRY